ncbi:hypothetical protein BC332_25429 [Capsicum chinense]|nr:hypothetical protein BC332_25429 [Capsicum chinense]
MNYAGAETSPQHFNPNVYQNLGENQDGTKINDEKMDETKLSDFQFTIQDELLPSLNIYRRESITTHPSTTYEEELIDEYLNDKKSESIIEDHCQVCHYPIVLVEIEKLAEIISFCLQACDLYDKKGIDLQNHLRYKDKDSSNMFDVLFEDNLPQQPSKSLDCGVYMDTYTECFSYGHKILSTDFDPNALRRRYAALLWDYGIRK